MTYLTREKAEALAATLNKDAAEDGADAWTYKVEEFNYGTLFAVAAFDETGAYVAYVNNY